MLDRGLHRSYARTAEAEAEDAVGEPHAADARVDLTALPTFTIDPEDAQDFDDAISARREDGHVRVWVHIADVTAYLRPGGPLEREAQRRATSVYVPGAVEPMLPEALSNRACSLRPGEERLAVTVEMELHGAEARNVSLPPLARAQRPAPHLPRGGRDLRRQRPGRGAVGGAARGRPRGVAGAGRATRLAGARRPRAGVRVRRGRPRDRGAPRGADRVAPADRAADDPGQRAGGELPGRPQAAHALPRARAPGAHRRDLPRRAAGEPRRAHAGGAQAHDATAGRRPHGGGVAHAGGLSGAPLRPRNPGAARAQAGLLHAQEPRPRRARQPALLPLHLADPPLPGRGGPPRAAAGARHRPDRRAGARARRARRAVLVRRAGGHADRARRRRHLSRVPARAPPGRRRSRWRRPPSRARWSG